MFSTCGKTSNFNNKPTSGNTNPCAIHTKWRKHYVHWESISIDLEKWPFWSLTFLASSDEEILKYSFRTEVQPGSHSSADIWPFASKSNTQLLFSVHVSNMELEAYKLNTSIVIALAKMFCLCVKVTLTLNNWPESLCESSCWDIVPIRICCTVRETE